MKISLTTLVSFFVLAGCTTAGIGSGYVSQPIITPTYTSVADSNVNPCGLSVSDKAFYHTQGVGNPGVLARDFATANGIALTGAAAYMGVCTQADAARQAMLVSYGGNSSWRQQELKYKIKMAMAEAYKQGYKKALQDAPESAPAPAPAVAATLGTAPQPTLIPPIPEKGKGKGKGKSKVAEPVVAPVPSAPVVSAVGIDLTTGIAAAKNFPELIAVFQREAANPASPKSGQAKSIVRMLNTESANPDRFEKIRGDLARAYAQ